MRILTLTLLTACLILPSAARAHEEGRDKLPDGHVRIHLSVSEQAKTKPDTLHASLRYQVDGASANETQDRINKAMKKAVDTANAVPGVVVSTGAYHVYETSEQNGGINPATGKPFDAVKKWQGMQTIDLEGKDDAAITKLAGDIQALGFQMNGLSFSLSKEKADRLRDDLMVKALANLKAKADKAAAALGKKTADLTEVQVDAQSHFRPMMKMEMARGMAAMAADSVAAPVAEAGETDVTLTVNGEAVLKP